MSLIELQNVSAGYGKNVILKDFCINIEEGKLVSLLGPSGCGKTTTLRTMAGFIDVLNGKFLFDGRISAGCRSTSAASATCSRATRCSRT